MKLPIHYLEEISKMAKRYRLGRLKILTTSLRIVPRFCSFEASIAHFLFTVLSTMIAKDKNP